MFFLSDDKIFKYKCGGVLVNHDTVVTGDNFLSRLSFMKLPLFQISNNESEH